MLQRDFLISILVLGFWLFKFLNYFVFHFRRYYWYLKPVLMSLLQQEQRKELQSTHFFVVLHCSLLSPSLTPSISPCSLTPSFSQICLFFFPQFKCAFFSPLIQSQEGPRRDVSSELLICWRISLLSFSESQLEINSFFC